MRGSSRNIPTSVSTLSKVFLSRNAQLEKLTANVINFTLFRILNTRSPDCDGLFRLSVISWFRVITFSRIHWFLLF